MPGYCGGTMTTNLPEPVAAQRLDALESLPVAEHVERLEALYRELSETLHENGT